MADRPEDNNGQEWGSFQSMNLNDISIIKEAIEESGMEPELMRAMLEELAETETDSHNVLFVSTNGPMAVKAIHVPASALDGKDGPVFFPHSNPRVILVAFSRDYINEGLREIEELEPGLRDEGWEEFIGALHDLIEAEYILQGPAEDPFEKGLFE